ncbi:hypothetical protein NBRC116188_23630 [Oceaniserpentilla sp. 4NH20-0058]|uniref:MipA/OmpV family protein n=1 Tax=Oceaniserpentilla sp. 4NH20-0058 TaxID=3127660 RepID=UPI003104021B
MKHIPLIALLLTVSPLLFAHDWQLPEFNGLIAPAIGSDDLPYQQVNTKTQPSLLIFGRLGDAFIEGNRIGYPIKRFGFGNLSAIGQLRTHQYLEASDTNLTNQDRERAIEVGPQFSVPLGQGYVSQFSLFQDISGKHDAQEFEAAIYKRFVFEDLRLVTTLAAQYQSEKLMDYYVGTDNYAPRSEWTQEIELLAVYDLNENWSIVAMWRYYKHGKEFESSPLTSGDTTQRFAFGIGHHF